MPPMIKLSANDHTQGFADQLRAMSDWECTEFVHTIQSSMNH
ncbi:hypothetical protein BofuT4_P076570.1 [Botrytis cinerea T4]|uniref:Uncharacterized protein n=1 Tax=Botryotinia fuckeliana (strain T4) TaxID=999810 RepID=G2XNW8_BOTF4|nr:hypothetical protein BofuT4_P076570.1 [Botrytis cinerea T4]